MGKILTINLPDFEHHVIEVSFQQPVLVDFWAEWCSPCLVIAPILESVVNDHLHDILLAKLEVDEGENMKLAGRYRVRGFPTVILFSEGKELGRFSGAKTKRHIEKFIADSLAL